MSLTSLINRPCLLIRRSESGDTDDYGNDIATETIVATVCEIQQIRRTEPATEGELSQGDWVAFFLPGTALDTSDAIEVDGLGTFELVGGPWVVRNPRTQQESHVEASLRRTAGAEDLS